MKKIYVLMMAAVALSFVSCNKQDGMPDLPSDVVVNDEGLIPIAFTLDDSFESSVQAETRAPSTVYSSSSKPASFYVLASTGTPGNSAETTSPGFTSSQFAKFGSETTYRGGDGSSAQPKYWPKNDPSYHMYASTKTLTLSSGAVTFKPSATVADDLYAYVASTAYSGGNPPATVALAFNHIYARVGYCNVTGPSGYTVSNLTVRVTPKLPTADCTFNVRNGAWSTNSGHYSNGSAVTLCSATGSTTNNDLWLVPGDYTLTASYTLTKGDYVETFQKNSNVTFQMGKVNNITASLPTGNAAEIVFTVSVADWGTNAINITFPS